LSGDEPSPPLLLVAFPRYGCHAAALQDNHARARQTGWGRWVKFCAAMFELAARDEMQGPPQRQHPNERSTKGFSMTPIFPMREARPKDLLAPREREILKLIGEGLSRKQIAQWLGLEVSTVESYRTRIKQKLRLRDARELLQYAICANRAEQA